jgi:NADPH:quinone reductase
MRAAWYEKQGPAREVLVVGEMPDPRPGAGEVRIRIAASGIKSGRCQEALGLFWHWYAIPARHSAQR